MGIFVSRYLYAGCDGDADGVDELRWNSNTFPGRRRQPSLVKVRVDTRRLDAAPDTNTHHALHLTHLVIHSPATEA